MKQESLVYRRTSIVSWLKVLVKLKLQNNDAPHLPLVKGNLIMIIGPLRLKWEI